MKYSYVFVFCLLLISPALSAQEKESVDSYSGRLEFSARAVGQIYTGSINLTAGVRLGERNVLGLGAGYGLVYYDAVPADNYLLGLFCIIAIICHWVRISLYNDLCLGGTCVLASDSDQDSDKVPQPGDLGWYFSWQPGVSLRLGKGKTNIFFGPSILPSIGAHLSVAF